MGRRAQVIRTVEDANGEQWDVREERPTILGFDVFLGWPAGEPRGKGAAGGVRIVPTAPLLEHLRAAREEPEDDALPIGQTALKRLRKLAEAEWRPARAEWWARRIVDLVTLSNVEFARRHDVSEAIVSLHRHRLTGQARTRERGWWTKNPARAILEARRRVPEELAASLLGIARGSVRRLRWMLDSGLCPTRERAVSDRRLVVTYERFGSLNATAAFLGTGRRALQWRLRDLGIEPHHGGRPIQASARVVADGNRAVGP